MAGRVAAAVQGRQLEMERAAAKVVPRSLLPTRLPQLTGVEFAARYVPAEIGGVGGDWYDAFALPNGRLWVMVGDIVGHGMQAALVMGRLRSTLRSKALDDHPPEEVLTRADRKLQFFEPGETATVLCAALDPPYRARQLSLDWATHPRLSSGQAVRPRWSRSSPACRSAATATPPGPRSSWPLLPAPSWSPTPTGSSNGAASPSTMGLPCRARPHTPGTPRRSASRSWTPSSDARRPKTTSRCSPSAATPRTSQPAGPGVEPGIQRKGPRVEAMLGTRGGRMRGFRGRLARRRCDFGSGRFY